MSKTCRVHSTTFDTELRNVSFPLISFMGFPAILSTLQSFQICIYNRKYSKLTFSNGSELMGQRFMANLYASLDSTCKSRISKISTRYQNGGHPQPTSNTHLISEKAGTEMIMWSNVNALSTIGWGVHSTTFDAELRNVSFPLISFMGFPAILSTLQPFQIYIYNRI